MSRAERAGLPDLFKLRLTRNAKRLIERATTEPDWVTALRLVGWSWQRRVILRRAADRADGGGGPPGRGARGR
jgi:hypothetical protein